MPWALERARLRPGSRVLDVGCGASVLPPFLAEQGHAVVAVDRARPRLRAFHGLPYTAFGVTLRPA